MKAYAIKHKTKGYLPAMKAVKGYTGMSPTHKGLPRLFNSRSAARNALNWWLKGGVSVEHRYVTIVPYGNIMDKLTIDPIPGRNAEDMSIVEMEVSEVHE